MSYSYDRQLGIFYMHYHMNMITRGTAFVEPVCYTDERQNPTFPKQTDHTGLEPGWAAWQTETITIMLFPHPHVLMENEYLSPPSASLKGVGDSLPVVGHMVSIEHVAARDGIPKFLLADKLNYDLEETDFHCSGSYS